jgi:hypothetical protein
MGNHSHQSMGEYNISRADRELLMQTAIKQIAAFPRPLAAICLKKNGTPALAH